MAHIPYSSETNPPYKPFSLEIRVWACLPFLGLLWLIEVSLFRCCLGLAWLGLALLALSGNWLARM